MSERLLRRIEMASVRGWPALQTKTIDGWLWRYTSGGSVRANSVATLDWSGADVDAAIVACETNYRACGAPAVFTISPSTAPHDLDDRLKARGYTRSEEHLTLAKPAPCRTENPINCSVADRCNASWLEVYLSGLAPNRRAAAPSLLDKLTNSNACCNFVGDLTDGQVTSTGLTVIDGDVASIQCMATRPAFQRCGGASRVLATIASIAASNPTVQHLYLQTGADNLAAQALYHAHGFSVHGHYHTRTKLF